MIKKITSLSQGDVDPHIVGTHVYLPEREGYKSAAGLFKKIIHSKNLHVINFINECSWK